MRWIALLVLAFPALAPAAELKFEVSAKAGLIAKPVDGRMIVVVGPAGSRGLLRAIGETGMDAPPILGKDALQFAAGKTVVLDAACPIFPIESLAKLPKGRYSVQAVLHHNLELNTPPAEGNYLSAPRDVDLDPAIGGTIALELSQQIPMEDPKDTASIRYVKLKSELLSRFHGRPMYLRAGVKLPPGFAENPKAKYPLRVHIGGYGTRYTAIGQFANFSAPMLVLHVDGAGPYGDPYYVDSDNNGPYGRALTEELIPFVEKTFRGVGAGYARFTDGASTGGWVSLALQIHYPEYFNGCWSFAPDPVDFKSYELIDIYKDENAYVNKYGFEKPAKRDIQGETVYTVRHECSSEIVMGRGDSWWRSGKDWCAWNAVFGPRGADGQPKPLWEGRTGRIDRSVVDAWKKHELRRVLEEGWPTKHAKWAGKIHVYAGDADDYFLNNAVVRMRAAAQKFDPPFDGVIQTGPYAGHGYHPVKNADMVKEMLDRFEKGAK